MMRSAIRTAAIMFAVLLVVAVAAVLWYTREQSVGWFTNGREIRQPAARTVPRDVLWLPPVELGEPFNTAEDEYEPHLAGEGALLFFVRGKAGENADIYFATRSIDGWSEPAALDAINTEHEELGPEPTPDGRSLYFYSDRPGGQGGYDIWLTHYRDGTWQEPVNLGIQVNTGFNEYGPALAPGGERLYFSSNRPQPEDAEAPDPDAWPATVREDLYRRTYDIYSSPITERGVGEARPVPELNSPYNDGAPAVSSVGDFLYFTSDRPGGEGGFDIYRCRLLDGGYVDLKNLGPEVNTTANELDPGLALRGFRLYFSSDRIDAAGEAGARRGYDLYSTTSREVFLDTETYRASIDWRGLLAYLPWGLLALLLALLLLLLRKVALSPRYGALNLLTRCLLASAVIHALLMIMLGFWGVGTSLSNWIREGGGTQVALVSSAATDDLAAQLRGGLTENRFEPVLDSSEQREDLPPPAEPRVDEAELPVDRTVMEPEAHEDWTEDSADARDSAPTVPALSEDLRAEAVSIDVPLPETAAPIRENEASADVAAAVDDDAPMPRSEKMPAVNAEEAVVVHEMPRTSRAAVDEASASSLTTEASPEEVSESAVISRPADWPDLAELPTALDPDLPRVPEARQAPAEEAVQEVGVTAPRSARLSPTGPAEAVAEPMMQLDPYEADSAPEQSVVAADREIADTPGTSIASTSPGPREPIAFSNPMPIALELRSVPEGGGERSDEEQLVVAPQSERAARSDAGIPRPISRPHDPTEETTGAIAEVDLDDSRLVDALAAVSADAGRPEVRTAGLPALGLNPLEDLALPAVAGNEPAEEVEESMVVEAERTPPGVRVDHLLPDTSEASPRGVVLDPARVAARAETAEMPLLNESVSSGGTPAVDLAEPTEAGLSIPAMEIAVAVPMENAEPETAGEPVPRNVAEVPVSERASLANLSSPRGIRPVVEDSREPDMHRLPPPDPGRSLLPVEAAEDERPPERAIEHPARPATGLPLLPLDLAVQTPSEVAPPPDLDEQMARANGVIRGTVTNAKTGEALAGATVRLDLPEGEPITVVTDAGGEYVLGAPEVPDFIAVSASLAGFTPVSIGISAEELEHRVIERDFELMPQTPDLIVIENDPEVHHLGDNQFSGRINSQFQKRSEGRRFRAKFEISGEPPDGSEEEVVIVLFARGTQRENQIRINGRRVDTPLNHAPADGSFGEFQAMFPASWLKDGRNTLEIRSVWADPGRTDLDDFEFVNIRLYLPGYSEAPANPLPEDPGRPRG